MRLAWLVALAALAGCSAPQGTSPPLVAPAPAGLGLAVVAENFTLPLLYLEDSGGREFVVQQGGLVWRMEGASRALAVDVSNLTRAGGERGLLGMAFLDDHEVVLSYTNVTGDTTLQRATLRDDGPARLGDIVFTLHQPYPNHNGGDVVLGPDGWLWLGLGDGGSGGDPESNGQNPDALLASMLRFDVRNGSWTPHVWAKGLRNPWRFSFDGSDVWIGDVGQDRYEEIDVAPWRSPLLDFGWNAREGKHPYPGGAAPFMALTEPVAEYDHADGSCSVTGGFVYRGQAIPSLRGSYLFADYCSGHVWTLSSTTSGWAMARALEAGFAISSFGVDRAGEIVVCDHQGGRILRLVDR